MSRFNFPGNSTTVAMLAAASCADTAAATGSGATFSQSTTTADIKSLVVQSKQVRRYIRSPGTGGTGPRVVVVTRTGVKKSV